MPQNKLKSILKKRYQNPPGGETEHPFYIDCDLLYESDEINEVNQHEYILIEPGYRKRHEALCSSQHTEADELFRTALTKGASGIGKSCNVRRFILDWAEGKGNQEVQLIFPLPFRELNLLKERLNLIELLYTFFPELKEPGISDLENCRVGFVLDGLDEFRRSLDFKNSPKMSNVTDVFSVPTLLTNLVSGNILPSAHIWITSRPAAVSRIPPQYINEVTEIIGFTDSQKEEFFKTAISDKKQANAVITFLKSSKGIYNLCQIPFICSIAASIHEKQYIEDKICEPYALTPFFNDLLVLLKMGRHNVKMVDELGELALKQLMKGNTVFYEEDLRECNFDVNVAALYAKVKIPIFREDIGLHQKKIYYFGHTTIQEFFAAMWFLQSNGRQNEINSVDRKNQIERALWFFRDSSHLRGAVDMSMRSKTGHMDLFLLFLLGIAQSFNRMFSEAGFTPSTALPETVEYIKKKVMENPASPRTLNLLNCLKELNDYSLTNDGMVFLTTGIPPDAKYPRAHWSDLTTLLAADAGSINMIGLELQKRGDEELLRTLPLVKASKTTTLQYHNLTDKCCEGLASVLTSKVSHLKALDLSFNTLKDSGVELLAAGLAKPHCRLERLNLSGCRVKQKGFAALGKALQSNPSHLRELDLSGNEPGEAGVFHLVDGLKLVKCKLRILKLSNCKLGLELCQALARFLLDNPQPLRELDVSMNNLGDVGLDVLMGGLKFTQINKLELYCCQLTEKCCQHIAKNLVNVTSLRDLNLSNNNLKDEGVRMLGNAFGLPNCQLEKLNLSSCCIIYGGCRWLAIGINPSFLKELDISRNRLDDADVITFLTFLRTIPFSLEILRMTDCKLTDQCCPEMAHSLCNDLTNLIELDLSGNKLGDGGVKTLCTALTSKTCKLERLFLGCCEITAVGCSSLALALKSSHSSITQLGLMGNDTGEEGLRILSAIRDDPRYKLQTLE
uniref:NACHT domain-containing protein n=1 Tax=Esox lucius TaxID=8010 RepID=A0A3P8ZJ24_ESOLU